MCLWFDQPSLKIPWIICNTYLMLENLRRMFENLNFGKTGFKTCGFEKLCISYSCILLIFFNAWRILCKIDLMLKNLWKMFDDLNFGKTSFKTLFLKNITSHTHAFCSSISMLWGVSKMCLWFFQNCGFPQKFCEPMSFSIDPIYFFDQSRVF